eukprot:m.79420 g.79420  ORF g.79420 m.79420 type:complete len:1567 (-) comp14156_c1_seq5:209-4909(-)
MSDRRFRDRWITTANKFKYAEAFQSVGRRRMFRQIISRSSNIICGRVFDNDVCGIAVLHEDAQVILVDKGSGKIQYDTFIEHATGTSIKSGAFANSKYLLAIYTSKKLLLILDHTMDFSKIEAIQSVPVTSLTEGKKCTLRCIAWSSDDTLLAAGGEDMVARVYDVKSGDLLHTIGSFHHDIIVALAFSSTGQYLATGCKDKRARVFDISKPNFHLEFEHNADARCYAIAFSPDGSRFAVGADNNETVLIDLKLRRVRSKLLGHKDYVRAVMFTPDGRRVLSGGKDGQLFFYDVNTGQPVLTIRNVGWTVWMAQAADSSQFITASQEKSSGPVLHLNVFNIFHDHSSDMIMTLRMSAPVTALCFSRDGEKMFSGAKTGVVHGHDVTTFQEDVVVRAHSKTVTGIAVSASGLVASTSEDGTLVVFQAGQEHKTRTLLNSKTALTCVAVSPCGRFLACGNSAGCLYIFDQDDALVCHHQLCELPISAIDFGCPPSSTKSKSEPAEEDMASDAKSLPAQRSEELLLAVGCHNKTTVVLDAFIAVQEYANGGLVDDAIRCVITGHEKEVYAVKFSPDGAYLASGSRDKTVRVVDVATGQVFLKLQGHVDHVKGVCFSPKNEIISASLDAMCRIVPVEETSSMEERNTRFVELPSGGLCVDAAPIDSRFAQLAAVGCNDNKICFIDFSFTNQQPLFREMQMIAERAKSTGNYNLVATMIRRYPLVVHSEDRRGNTLAHYAVMHENDLLLTILLSAKLPQFWLPVNGDGLDILQLAVQNKSRSCVKLILDRIIVAKENNELCPLPSRGDRFLRTLLRLADDMDDLLAGFLKQFGLDDARGVLRYGDQLSLRSPQTIIVPSAVRIPEGLWNKLYEQDRLGEKDVGKVVRLQAKYLSIPNFAGFIRSSESVNYVACLQHTVLHRFVRTGNAQLFGNPLLKMVLDYKWHTYAGSLFMRELCIFCAFLLVFTVFSLTAPRISLSSHPVWQIFSEDSVVLCILLAFAVMAFSYRQLKNEYRQICRSAAVRYSTGTNMHNLESGYDDDEEPAGPVEKTSVRDIPAPQNPLQLLSAAAVDGWNLLQTSAALLAFLSAALFLLGSRWFVSTTSASAFLLWLEVLYFLRAFEFTGGLVRMVFKIFYYTGPFLFILIIVLLGTANCFHVLFSSIAAENALFSKEDSVFESIFKTFKLLLLGDGTVEDGLSPEDSFTGVVKLLFAVFMVVVNIFMLNLMINLMDDFMQKINDEEGDAFPFEKARIIAEIELSMGEDVLSNRSYFPRWLHMLTPKGGELGDREGVDEWQGTVQAIRTENAHLERRTRDTIANLQSQLLLHIETVEKRQADRISSLDDRVNNRLEAVADALARIQNNQMALLESLPNQGDMSGFNSSHRTSWGSIRSPNASSFRSQRMRSLRPTTHRKASPGPDAKNRTGTVESRSSSLRTETTAGKQLEKEDSMDRFDEDPPEGLPRREVVPTRKHSSRARQFRRDSTWSVGTESRRESFQQSPSWDDADDGDELVTYTGDGDETEVQHYRTSTRLQLRSSLGGKENEDLADTLPATINSAPEEWEEGEKETLV